MRIGDCGLQRYDERTDDNDNRKAWHIHRHTRTGDVGDAAREVDGHVGERVVGVSGVDGSAVAV